MTEKAVAAVVKGLVEAGSAGVYFGSTMALDYWCDLAQEAGLIVPNPNWVNWTETHPIPKWLVTPKGHAWYNAKLKNLPRHRWTGWGTVDIA